MPRQSAALEIPLPNLEQALYNLTVEDIKWYAAALPGAKPTRKGDLVNAVVKVLTDPAQLAQLWRQLTPGQQQVIGEVIYRQDGQYDSDAMTAKYPDVAAPHQPSSRYYGYYGNKPHGAAVFDVFFYYAYEVGQYIPPDLAARLQDFATLPPLGTMASTADPPTVPPRKEMGQEWVVETMVTDAERSIFHDLAATLFLVQEGKVGVSATTKMPTLPTLRHLRARLLIGDYFPEDYGRAEDGMRPLALILLAQAARWAAPAGGGNKLELTKTGKAALAAPPGAAQVREAWERWLKSDLLDELSRIRAIKGQQSKGARLTKPADRRADLVIALRALPLGRWVSFDELLRYMRAESLLPVIERNSYSVLYLGPSAYYGSIADTGMNYWDVVIGSYLRAVVWEYAATLGLVEIAYTLPEDSPHDFGHAYDLDEDYLSRYDGLLAVRLTNLGAYALGLAAEYTPPAPVAQGPPLLKVLPNLDLVITDRGRVLPNERAFLERIGTAQSEDVYRLNRDLLLDGTQQGLSFDQVRDFLTAKSGVAAADLPPTVRTFFTDLERRLGVLREGGRMIVLESDDPLILTELANDSALRGLAALGKIGDRTVLLIDESQETAARRQLKKLGYVPRK